MSVRVRVVIYGDKLDLADELEEEFHASAKQAVADAADILLDDVQRRLTVRTTGIAAEGEAPVRRRGNLERSYKRINPTIRGRVARSGIYSNHPGANRLEYGKTDTRGVRTLPHPAVRPAIEATEPAIDRLLTERLT